MFKFNPHFEMYCVKVFFCGSFVGYYFRHWNGSIVTTHNPQKWFFTKEGAQGWVDGSEYFEDGQYIYEIVRMVRSNRVRERLSQKAKA